MQQERKHIAQPVLPVKSVDQNKDVNARLSDNARDNIGPARYFQEDETSWKEVFDRVATNVALAELIHSESAPYSLGDAEHLNERCAYFELYTDGDTRDRYEHSRSDFFDVMSELRFIPNTPTLTSAGTELQQLAACFVDSPDDALTDIDDENDVRDSIFGTAEEWARIEQTGGGMGGAFHKLRPKGARIDSTGGVSSGPMAFIELFDVTGLTIKQGGVRSGAQMAVFHAHHPDVGRFAVSKRGEDTLTCFNISVGVTDSFIEAVQNDDTYTFENPKTGNLGLDAGPFETVPETAHFYDPQFENAWNDEYDSPGLGHDGKVVEENFWRDYYPKMSDPSRFDKYRDRIDIQPGEPMELPARFIWEMIIDGAYNNGEPGVIHLDRVNREHSFDVEEHPEYIIEATNPCGEQPLVNYESCNLGHVNLSLMVAEDRVLYDQYDFGPDNTNGDRSLESKISEYLTHAIDTQLLEETTQIGVRFLDNVITMSDFPLDEITDTVGDMRKIGLGVMGFHQMLMQLGIEYGSDESIEFARQLMAYIDRVATEASHDLAHERGVFPAWEDSKWSDPTEYPEWFEKHGHDHPDNWKRGYPIRNHNVTTVAPTGTTGRIGNTSLSIEPIFDVAYLSNVSNDIQGDEMLNDFDDYFIRTLRANDIDTVPVMQEAKQLQLANKYDGPQSLTTVPPSLLDLFVTANEITPEAHVDVLTAFQESVDSSISKTSNLPNDATHDDVDRIYRKALTEGAKSVTVYRDGSRETQVLTRRVDNGLEDDATTIDWLVDNLSNKTANEVVKELGLSDEDIQVECEECGSGNLDLGEACPVCIDCGHSPCI